MQACTIVARNYLPQARVLAESFKRYHTDAPFTVLIVDDPEEREESVDHIRLLRLAEIGLDPGEEYRMPAIYDVTELSTAVKPWLLRHLQTVGPREVIYFDPDIEIFSPLHDIAELARVHSIVIAPHATEPIPRDNLRPTESDILAAGMYNLGFIAVGGGGADFLAWWSERLKREAIIDPMHMRFTDQRWVDFVPSLFDHHLLRDRGCDVAYWNLHTRNLQWTGSRYEVDGEPLRFFHFSGYNPAHPDTLSRFQEERPRVVLGDNAALARICRQYGSKLLGAGFDRATRRPYGFAALPSGTPVDACMRHVYREALAKFDRGDAPEPPSPFGPAGEDAFIEWLNEPVAATRPAVTRYMLGFYELRADLHARFADPLGSDAAEFREWFINGNGPRLGFDHALIAAVRGSSLPLAAARRRMVEILVAADDAEITGVSNSLGAALIAAGVPYRIAEIGPELDVPLPRDDEIGVTIVPINGSVLSRFIAHQPQSFAARYTIALITGELGDSDAAEQQLDQFEQIWCANDEGHASLCRRRERGVFRCEFDQPPAAIGSSIRQRLDATIAGAITLAPVASNETGDTAQVARRQLRVLRTRSDQLQREMRAVEEMLAQNAASLAGAPALETLARDIRRLERGLWIWRIAEKLSLAASPFRQGNDPGAARREAARHFAKQLQSARKIVTAPHASPPQLVAEALGSIADLERTVGDLLAWMRGGWIRAAPELSTRLRDVVAAQLRRPAMSPAQRRRTAPAPELFDADWYLSRYEDVAKSGADPWRHYLDSGAAEGRNPNAVFQTSWYALRNPECATTNLNPLLHFIERGAAEDRKPAVLFDPLYYRAANPDVGSANPLTHYLKHGAPQRRNPHPLFRADWYLAQRPEIDASVALEDYLAFGAARGLSPHPLFDGVWYSAQPHEDETARMSPLEHYIETAGRAADPHPLFSTRWYLSQLGADGADCSTPLEHYLASGATQARDPHPLFDTAYYLAQSAARDTTAHGMTPLEHYAQYGATRRCSPHPMFDAELYARQLQEVASRSADFLQHYAAVGWKLGFTPNPSFKPRAFIRRDAGRQSTNREPFTAAEEADPSRVAAAGFNLFLGESGRPERYLVSGWSTTEAEFTWTEGFSAKIWLPTRGRAEPLKLRVTTGALVDPPRVLGNHVQVFVGTEKVADWHVAGAAEFEALIPATLSVAPRIVVEFRAARAASAKVLRLGDDARVLAIRVHRLALVPVDAAAAQRGEMHRVGIEPTTQ